MTYPFLRRSEGGRMATTYLGARLGADEALVTSGFVIWVHEHEALVALGDGMTDEHVICDRLFAAPSPVALAPGDRVLCWLPATVAERGAILGRIGRGAQTSQEEDEPPDEVVLEAKQSLTLRVGDGSITIREDGKILIKGKDLVSHATRTNRIKGGAVQIN